jgi:hypothetical protein
MMTRIALIALTASLTAACNQPATKIAASVEYDDAWQLQTLLIKAKDTPRSLQAQHDLTFVIPDDWAGAPVTFEMWGLVGDANKKAYAKVDVTPVLDDTVDATLSLKLLDCSTPCTVGTVRCDGDAGVATCLSVEGCGVWSQPVACPTATPFCSAGTCAATCTDECTMGTVQCDGTGATKTCGQADADSCLDWQAPVACPAAQTCSAGTCSASMICDNPTPVWKRVIVANPPTVRARHTMAFDAFRGETVMYGGSPGVESYPLDETWIWNGNQWTEKTRARGGPSRSHSMAYDAARQKVLVFGGYSTKGPYHENDFTRDVTMTWDGTDWRAESSTVSPLRGYDHAMAYDAARQRIVEFGGRGYTGSLLNYTFTWDGTEWTGESPASAPSERAGHAMAYDAAHREVVLFGGNNSKETWTWNGTTWTKRANAASGRSGHAMAYDATVGKVVLFGGYGASDLNSTWTWDGTNWKVESAVNPPPVRSYMAMAYDEVRKQIVLFGGTSDNTSYFNDTWTLDWTCP